MPTNLRFLIKLFALALTTGVFTFASNGAVFARNHSLLPHGLYNTTIRFQDGSGEIETGTLQFKSNGTLIERNSAVGGNHYGTWTSTSCNSFSLTFRESLSNDLTVTVNQADDEFASHNSNTFSGISVGTVYSGSTIVGQRTALVTASRVDE